MPGFEVHRTNVQNGKDPFTRIVWHFSVWVHRDIDNKGESNIIGHWLDESAEQSWYCNFWFMSTFHHEL